MSQIQSSIAIDAATPYVNLITLGWGTAFNKHAYYVSQAGSLVVDGITFIGLPELDLTLGKMTGSTTDDPTDLILPTVPPVDELTQSVAHSPIEMYVQEMDTRDYSTRRVIYYGRLSQTIQNPDGDPTHMKLTFDGLKNLLKVRLGIECGNTCPFIFGGYGCQLALAPLQQIGICANASTRFLQVNGISTTAFLWRRGYVEIDGLVLMVRDQPEGNILELMQPAPELWRNRPVLCTPGCNGTIADCTKWGNLNHFGGIGRKMPTQNPLYQVTG